MESPEYLKISTASAMALGFKHGRFYRGARNPCINLLLTYERGCTANCAYCGLARQRPGAWAERSFIHVSWPTLPVGDLMERMRGRSRALKRVCISMITNPRCVDDAVTVARSVSEKVDLPLSVLISPTIMQQGDLRRLREAGADMVGVAVDAATEELFGRYRGEGVKGPHRWPHYWRILDDAVGVFGPRKVSVHLIVGLGETDRQMCEALQKAHDAGALIHLFSFFAEPHSALAALAPPPWGRYLRMQLARHFIEHGVSKIERFGYDPEDRLVDFGVSRKVLEAEVASGMPFLTSGCPGKDGTVACNRPFGNCLPGPRQWNYPYLPDEEEMAFIRRELDV